MHTLPIKYTQLHTFYRPQLIYILSHSNVCSHVLMTCQTNHSPVRRSPYKQHISLNINIYQHSQFHTQQTLHALVHHMHKKGVKGLTHRERVSHCCPLMRKSATIMCQLQHKTLHSPTDDKLQSSTDRAKRRTSFVTPPPPPALRRM